MKKKFLLLTLLVGFISCKDEAVNKPDNLIAKDKMIDVMYDLSILEAMKYQNLASLDTYKVNPSQYIFKKYKIDSVQFAHSNIYYASNYTNYKEMYDDVIKRIEAKKIVMDSLVKKEDEKLELLKADSIKKIKETLGKKDSLLLKKLKFAKKNTKDSLLIK
jgi:hypothetical protein